MKAFLLKAIKISTVLVLLTPLVLGPFGLNFSEYPKAVFFRSLIEIIFVFYIFLVLSDPSYLPKKSILLFSIILFDVILMLASLWGVNFYRSFFGDMQRGEGIILHLHLLVFFIILTCVVRKKEDWLGLFKITAVVGGVSVLAAIFQQLKIASFYGYALPRLSGTLSNPDFFGSYAVLLIFLSAFLFFSEQKKKLRIIWVFLIILDFYGLLFSGTRGAWVGFAFGILCLYILNYRNLSHKKRICSLLFMLLVSLSVLLLPMAITKMHLENNNFGQRILDIYNLNLNGRENFWGISMRAFQDRPLLGWGFESFPYVYDKYVASGYVNGGYVDRPHNKLAEILVYCGLVGLLGYLLIFFAIFYLVRKSPDLWKLPDDKKRGIYAGSIILAFFVSGFVQNIFSFDNMCTYLLFFLVAGFINNIFYFQQHQETKALGNLQTGKIIAGAAIALFIAIVFYQLNVKPTVAVMYFPSSLPYESTDLQKAFEGYQKAISEHTIYDKDLRANFAGEAISILESDSGENIERYVLGKMLAIKPYLFSDLVAKDQQMPALNEYIARTDEWDYILNKNKDSLAEMESVLQNAMHTYPDVPVFPQLMGELRILQGRDSQGETYISQSCDLNPGCPGTPLLYREIGIAYYKSNNYKDAAENFYKVVNANFSDKEKNPGITASDTDDARFLDSVAIIYYKNLNDFSDAQKIYKRATADYPEYAQLFISRLEIMASGGGKN